MAFLTSDVRELVLYKHQVQSEHSRAPWASSVTLESGSPGRGEGMVWLGLVLATETKGSGTDQRASARSRPPPPSSPWVLFLPGRRRLWRLENLKRRKRETDTETAVSMSMEDYDFLFKIVLIGNAGVGKTCLVRRFTQGLFPPGQGATIGVDFMIKTVEINGEKVKLQIWDTAGQERFRSITQSYYRSANALILTYDITCEESFRCLPEWLREIEQYASNKVITVLVGNKIDLAERREVSQQRAEEFSEAQDMYYLETSAKESDNVEKLFLDLACRLISEARQNTLVNNVASPLPGEGKSISYLTCCNFN